MKFLLLVTIATSFSAESVSAQVNSFYGVDQTTVASYFPYDAPNATTRGGQGGGQRGGSEIYHYPDYCDYQEDYNCFRRGVPSCCIRNKHNCPNRRPSCDTNKVGEGGYCRRDRDECLCGYACVDGICQDVAPNAVGKGDVCRHIDSCDSGTACIKGRCRVPRIEPDERCDPGDVCVSGYSCIQGRCRPTSTPIEPDERCDPDDVCVSGYSCIQGRCRPTRTPIAPGGRCEEYDVCVNGYFCNNGRCEQIAPSPSPIDRDCNPDENTCGNGNVCFSNRKCGPALWYKFHSDLDKCVVSCRRGADRCCGGFGNNFDKLYDSAVACCSQSAFQGARDECIQKSNSCDKAGIPYGGACQFGDRCVTGYTCVNGRCGLPPIQPGQPCSSVDICTQGYQCRNGRCDKADIPYGGVCQFGDRCVTGYTCVNGRCGLPPVQPGQPCSSVDICTQGYQCQNGRCGNSGGTIPINGDCTNDRNGCAWPNTCSPSQLNGSDRWNCQPSGNSGGTIPLNGDCTNNRNGCAWPNTCSPSQLNGSDRWNCQRSNH